LRLIGSDIEQYVIALVRVCAQSIDAMSRNTLQDTDEALMSRVQSGDREAYAMLVHRHSDRFYALAWRMCGDAGAGEDIVQEAFLKIWIKAKNWDPERGAKFTTWFSRIVLNAAYDYGRKKKNMPATGNDFVHQVIDNNAVGEDRLEILDKQSALEAAIQSLPARQKEALNLCFYEEISNKEAASILGIGVKALESLLMRAKKSVRDYMMRNGYAEYLKGKPDV